MVSDVDADDPSVSVTCGGVKLQAAPAGRPEHANATVPAKPHLDVTCIASGEEAEPLATAGACKRTLSPSTPVDGVCRVTVTGFALAPPTLATGESTLPNFTATN